MKYFINRNSACWYSEKVDLIAWISKTKVTSPSIERWESNDWFSVSKNSLSPLKSNLISRALKIDKKDLPLAIAVQEGKGSLLKISQPWINM